MVGKMRREERGREGEKEGGREGGREEDTCLYTCNESRKQKQGERIQSSLTTSRSSPKR
jgi:hypothetical protein